MRDVLKEIYELSPKDKARLSQCITCEHDPETCGKEEKDEDENGLCRYHLGLDVGTCALPISWKGENNGN